MHAGAMFHDMGRAHPHASDQLRLREVDGANVARDFLKRRGIPQQDVDLVWTAIALHTTPAFRPTHAPGGRPGDRRRGNGCAGIDYYGICETPDREVWCRRIRVRQHAKENIIQTVLQRHQAQADAAFANVMGDVIADKEPHFHRGNFAADFSSVRRFS